MTHRAEQIITTVKTSLNGLTTTGDRVFRAGEEPLSEDQVPGLILSMGAEQKLNDLSGDRDEWLLPVDVRALVKINETYETLINTIRSEVHIQLMQDITQGLPFVVNTIEDNPTEIEIDNEGDVDTASQVFTWLFQYRRNKSTPD